jgi:two-component system, OmpR family, response regulator MprA
MPLERGRAPEDTPAGPDGLLSRLQARLRRRDRGDEDDENDEETLHFSDVTLDSRAHTVRRGRRPIELTPIEFSLLELLMRNPQRVLERGDIFNHVWGFDPGSMSNSLNVYVGYLRRKTEAEGAPRLIHTVRGVGYVLREPYH